MASSFGERFGVDARRLDETLFAGPLDRRHHRPAPRRDALAEALRGSGWDMGVDAALPCWFEEDFVVEPAVLAAATAWSELGIPLALVSNQEPRRARFLQERLETLLPVCGVAFSGDLGVVKSNPVFYDRAERLLGVVGLGHGVVFLDDTLGNVETATRHGWRAVHFTRDKDWQREVAAALEHAAHGPAPS